MSKEIRREMKDGSEYVNTVKEELTDEQLEAITGGEWNWSTAYSCNDSWGALFDGRYVVWREPGVGDHWGKVVAYRYCDNVATDFDIDFGTYVVYNIPANQVLIEFAN